MELRFLLLVLLLASSVCLSQSGVMQKAATAQAAGAAAKAAP
jgi:uncharacterized protein (UPF0333 family)